MCKAVYVGGRSEGGVVEPLGEGSRRAYRRRVDGPVGVVSVGATRGGSSGTGRLGLGGWIELCSWVCVRWWEL